MNVANRELCQELYRLSGWDFHHDVNDMVWIVSRENELDAYVCSRHESLELPDTYWLDSKRLPAYDLGHLMRQLPRGLDLTDAKPHYSKNYLYVVHHDDFWTAGYQSHISNGSETQKYYFLQSEDTPEDATAKLAIALFNSGLLKREGNV